MILSRGFIEYCVKGWNNFPRKLLLYLSNVAFPLEAYFQTIICNSPEFENTTINHDLRYISQNEPHALNISDYDKMLSSDTIFGRPFKEGDQVLSKIDKNILNCTTDGFGYGKWHTYREVNATSSSTGDERDWGDINSIEPGIFGARLGEFFSKLVAEKRWITSPCISKEN